MDGEPLRIGVVGCSEGTHGKVWAEMLSAPGGERFGMRPAVVWDEDREQASKLATAIGARLANTAEECGLDVDGVMVTELLPTRYLELSRPFLKRRMRVFYNRPFAGSVRDAHEILRLADQHGARVYSASALFHTAAGTRAKRELASLQPVRLFTVTGPTDHLGFYLPHAIAALVSVMGGGVERVQAVSLSPSTSNPLLATEPVVVYVEYGARSACPGARGVVQMVGPGARWYAFLMKLVGAERDSDEIRFEVSYDALLHEMARFFRTGEEPIDRALLLEQNAIYHAALASAARHRRAVRLEALRHTER